MHLSTTNSFPKLLGAKKSFLDFFSTLWKNIKMVRCKKLVRGNISYQNWMNFKFDTTWEPEINYFITEKYSFHFSNQFSFSKWVIFLSKIAFVFFLREARPWDLTPAVNRQPWLPPGPWWSYSLVFYWPSNLHNMKIPKKNIFYTVFFNF